MQDSGDDRSSGLSTMILDNAMMISAWLGGASLLLLLVGGLLVLLRNGHFEPVSRRQTHRAEESVLEDQA